jgi:glycosyltransferase involved in cell wall biosynthesis
MRVCIVGGIFGRTAEYLRRHRFAPEAILAEGLRQRGLEVDIASHQAFRPSDRWDIVHVHHLAEGAVRAASAATRARFVFTGHDGAILCGYERSPARRRAFEYVIRRADALVALSRCEAAFLAARFALGDRTTVIPNGVPSDVFTLREEVRRREKPTLLSVGQLIELKGVDVLFRALARLPSPIRPWLRLVYHNASLERQLRTLAAQLEISNRVEFCGALEPEALSAAYSECHALVLPSHAEALPSVVTEAMLCGTPVIASAVGGVPEQVGDLGYLFPPGSVEGLARVLEFALTRLPSTTPADRLALRAHAQAHSSVPTMIDGHLHAYAQAIRRHGERRPRVRGVMDHLAHSAMELYRWAHPTRGSGPS